MIVKLSDLKEKSEQLARKLKVSLTSNVFLILEQVDQKKILRVVCKAEMIKSSVVYLCAERQFQKGLVQDDFVGYEYCKGYWQAYKLRSVLVFIMDLDADIKTAKVFIEAALENLEACRQFDTSDIFSVPLLPL